MIMCYISLNFGILKGQMDGFMGPGPGERLWAECGHRSVLEVPLTGDLHSRWTPGFFCVDPGMGTPGWDEDGGRGERYHEIYPNKRLDIEIFLHHSTYIIILSIEYLYIYICVCVSDLRKVDEISRKVNIYICITPVLVDRSPRKPQGYCRCILDDPDHPDASKLMIYPLVI